MAKRVRPGEKPFNPVEAVLARSVLQPPELSQTVEEAIAKDPPVELGDYLDELMRGPFAFAERGESRGFLTAELYTELQRESTARGLQLSQYIQSILKRRHELS